MMRRGTTHKIMGTTISNPKAKFLVHHRSKTALLLVHQLEDVAPVAAMCALLGDLHRHRTLFASNSRHHQTPIIVLRVAVVPSLRHYFVRAAGSTGGQERIVTWRAHERSSSSLMAARWITHVGAPDSIWTLENNNSYEKAFYGEHDDGGMADMILVGSSSSLSFPVLQDLALLVESLPANCHKAAQPLVIATLGSLRGLDWLSRRAFAEVNTSNHHHQQSTGPRMQRRRPLALVGFPNLLWYCRMIPQANNINSKKIHTKLSQENSIVLMVGRESSSSTRQPVCLLFDQVYPASWQQDAVLLLLRQTLLPPRTELEICPPFALSYDPIINSSNNSLLAAGKPPMYAFVWYMLQDHHMIQFPCFMAIFGTTDGDQRQRRTLGSLILSVLQEVLSVLHHLFSCMQQSSSRNCDQQRLLDESFCESITDPLQLSLLAKLLGTGGTLMEDLSNNRMTELVARMRWLLQNRFRSNNNNKNNNNCQAVPPEAEVKQRWILEPLLTRAALAEWQTVMQQSPYQDATTCPTLIRQVQNDSVRYGLSLILQVGQLLKLPNEFLTNTEWVVRRALAISSNGKNEEMTLSEVPLNSWGIQTVDDLREFLLRYPPLGGMAWPKLAPVAPMRSKL